MQTRQKARTFAYDLQKMAETAVKSPEKIPPFVRERIQHGPGRLRSTLATKRRLAGLPHQLDRVNALRETDDYLLIVLDACRYDVFANRFDHYFEGECEPVASAGHDTFEYVSRVWHRRHADADQHDVTYISGATPVNGQPRFEFDDHGLQRLYRGFVPREHIREIVDAWESEWDSSVGTVPPEGVTRRALDRVDDRQLVAHYFQPHTPYIGDEQYLGHADNESAHPGQGDPVDKPIWDAVEAGEITDERLRELYASNLDRALPEVCRLIEAAPQENIVIMGDHGEALGEYGIYAHPRLEHPKVRAVPWAEVTGLSSKGKDLVGECSKGTSGGDADAGDVRSRLADLGYLE